MSVRSVRGLPGLAVILALAACSSSKPETAPAPAEQSRKDASTVTSQTMERSPQESIEKHLEGRVAGVVVGPSPRGGISVRIRGATSYANEQPLYILDGMAIAPGPGGALVGLNPYDIESIKVLKGPTETAIYGSRGANGVIVIKTKKGKPQG